MPPPLLPHLIPLITSRQNDDNSITDPMSGITSGVIIAISVSAVALVLILLSVVFYCYCYSSPRSNTADTLYYKFDYNSSSLASMQSDPDTLRNTNTNTRSTSANMSRPPSDAYLADTFSDPFGPDTPAKSRTNSKNKSRNRSGRSIPSYASMDDGISAPRTLESEVPSSKVAFLDDHGRPITTPL